MRAAISHSTFVILFVWATSSPAAEVSFNRDIRPILSNKCLLCHGPDASHRKADLRLDLEEVAKAAVIKPGRPEDSELIARITSADPDQRMPPAESGKRLSADEIRLLKQWVQQGAQYDAHWSFIPPQRSHPPSVGARVESTIDRFVLKRLESAGLTLAAEASRAELIRRVSLDLTGLPPTPHDIAAFESYKSSQAWEKVVDRLLESDRFGEHIARYWLDSARYADTNGYQYDLEREQWVWRDWVIHAFNTNMPFDQFTVEQLAGDLLPNATNQQKLATAFHRNHPITIEGGVIDEEYRTEYVVDRVVTTSTVWMGLTMLCCRCHDHKYDPISQREFYEFFAFFNQVPEKGKSGFDPKLKVKSPLRSKAMTRAERQLAVVEGQFHRLNVHFAEELNAWEAQLAREVADQWTVFVPDVRTSLGGAELVVQPDKSVLATGENPLIETYELIHACKVPVYAIRLEALTHGAFVGGGTGRGSNGNFVLSEFRVAASSVGAPDRFVTAQVASATADYSQKNYDVSLAIDGKLDRSGWAVDGHTKVENRLAVFELAKPLTPPSVAKVRIRLQHHYGGYHHIGRFRIAFASQPITAVPGEVATIVGRKSGQWNSVQQHRLNEYLIERFGSEEHRVITTQLKTLRQRRAELDRTPATMVMADLPIPRTTHVLFRGEYDKPRDVVTAGTPSVFLPMPERLPRNRLGLARWLVMPDHPLTARVTVNRFWQHLFGSGIVETLEDFGSQGDWPSHPQLLDWLAVEFVESGWNTKALLKQIVMSATYRQSSRVTEESQQRDPKNRLLSRGPRMRLDAEVIRDSALFVSGLLTDQLGGPSVFPYHPPGLWQEINNRPGYSRVYKQDSDERLYRRSLYTFWKRTVPPPSMAVFDAPEREYCIVRRSRTNTPLQALVMLHDPQFVEAAREIGRRILTEGGPTAEYRIEYGFRLCLSRRPRMRELRTLKRMLDDRLKQYRHDPAAAAQLLSVGDSAADASLDQAELAAWTTIGRVLLNLSEFVTKG